MASRQSALKNLTSEVRKGNEETRESLNEILEASSNGVLMMSKNVEIQEKASAKENNSAKILADQQKETNQNTLDSISQQGELAKLQADQKKESDKLQEKYNQIANKLNDDQKKLILEQIELLKGDKLQSIEDKKEALQKAEEANTALENIANNTEDLGNTFKKGLDGLSNRLGGGFFGKIISGLGTAIITGLGVLFAGGGLAAAASAMFAPLAPLFATISTVFTGFISTLGKLFIPLTIAIGIIGAIIGAVKGFKKEGIVGAIKGLFTGALDILVGSLLGVLNPLIKGFTKMLGIGEFGEALVETLDSIYNLIRGSFVNLIDAFKALFTGDIEGVKAAIAKQFANIGDVLKKFFMGLIPQLANVLFIKIPLLFVKIGEGILNLIGTIGSLIGNALVAMKQGLTNALVMLPSLVVDGVVFLVDKLKELFFSLPDNIKDPILNGFAKIKDFIGGIFEKGSEIFQGLKDIVLNPKQTIKDILKSILPRPDDSKPFYSPANLAAKAIPAKVYEFAGIDKSTGQDIPEPKVESVEAAPQEVIKPRRLRDRDDFGISDEDFNEGYVPVDDKGFAVVPQEQFTPEVPVQAITQTPISPEQQAEDASNAQFDEENKKRRLEIANLEREKIKRLKESMAEAEASGDIERQDKIAKKIAMSERIVDFNMEKAGVEMNRVQNTQGAKMEAIQTDTENAKASQASKPVIVASEGAQNISQGGTTVNQVTYNSANHIDDTTSLMFAH